MYQEKIIKEGTNKKILNQCRWKIENNVHYEYLTISDRAQIVAPEGKILTMLVAGVPHDIVPGEYCNVDFVVHVPFLMGPHGLMNINQIARYLDTAICVEDGKLSGAKCVPGAVHGGKVTDTAAENITIAASEDSFNGVVVAGKSDYIVDNACMDLEGMGDNDYIGVGAAVTAVDDARVTIKNSKLTMSGPTRCAVHVGGSSTVHVSDCELINLSPDSERLEGFSWSVGFKGSNRLCQLADNGTVTYERCHLRSNGWALCSLDGTDEKARLHVKDSLLELRGARTHGYGVFCIGSDVEVTVDHSVVDVFGFPMLIMGMEGKARPSVINGSELRGREYGAVIVGDDNSVFTIRDSAVNSGKACIVVKGSASRIDVKNARLHADNGVILQLMDTDECDMNAKTFFVPVDETDIALPDRDLTAICPAYDVVMDLRDMEAQGDFFNSTSNIRAERRAEKGGMGKFHDTVVGEVSFTGPRGDGAEGMPPMKDLRGPKNLLLRLTNARITGAVSSAVQSYRPGVSKIDAKNCEELSNIKQQAAKTVNNGVIVELDAKSVWTLTKTCYITSLRLAEGAALCAAKGKKLRVMVDDVPCDLGPGEYKGKIELYVED